MVVDPSQLLTVAEAARRTPFSEPALRAKILRGEIQCVRLGGHIFVAETELRAKLGDLYQPSGSRFEE